MEMTKKEEFIKKWESSVNNLLITVLKMPFGSFETIINSQNLDEKVNYILNAYDNDLRLKTYEDIQIIDYIIV